MTTGGGSTRLRWAGATDVGKVRSNNQDTFRQLPGAKLWIVADGMGGHKGGEVASKLACDEMENTYRDATVDGLITAVSAANRAVYEAGQADPDLRGMGTTMVALAVVEADEHDQAPTGETLAIANVGDSRAYRMTSGRLEQLTEDHSLVADMVREGSLSPDEAESHPQKNILTRVLGVYEEIPVDVVTAIPQRGDRYLLCSDGLFNEVSEDTIAAVLHEVEDPDRAVNELVRLALQSGARDNTTVVLVDVLAHNTADPVSAAAMARTQLATAEATAIDPAGARMGGAYTDPDDSEDDYDAGVSTERNGDSDDPPPKGRHARRDKREKPRRFTWRVGFFVLLVLAVLGGAVATIQWYAKAVYYVGFDGDEVAIYHGRPGGIAWINPELVETSPLQRGDVPAQQLAALDEGREFSSLDGAEEFVARMEEQATTYLVGFDDNDVAIFHDRPGEEPDLVETAPLARADVPRDDRSALDDGQEFPTLTDAQDFLSTLEKRVKDLQEQEDDEAVDDAAAPGDDRPETADT